MKLTVALLTASMFSFALASVLPSNDRTTISSPVNVIPDSRHREVEIRQPGYEDEYSYCSQQKEDTLCTPSNQYPLGRTFDLLFKGKDGYHQTTDYVTLAFINTRDHSRVNIDSLYGGKVPGDRSLIQADNIYIPCGTRGEYFLSVMDNFVDNDGGNYHHAQETWFGPFDVDTQC